jgi:hypothetical protein
MPSPDGTRLLRGNGLNRDIIGVHDDASTPPRGVITLGPDEGEDVMWSPNGNAAVTYNKGNTVGIWTRVRDDSPGAFLFLPELWLAIAFFGAFLFSVRNDLRRLRCPV